VAQCQLGIIKFLFEVPSSLAVLSILPSCLVPIRSVLSLHLPASGISLLVDVMLGTTLLGLADVVLVLVLRLLSAVTSHARDSVAERALGAVRQAGGEVVELAASLLLLALAVLLPTGLLEVLGADQSADGLLGRADGLVVRTGGAVGVVLGDGAGRRGGEAGDLCRGVRGIVLGVALVLLGCALGL